MEQRHEENQDEMTAEMAAEENSKEEGAEKPDLEAELAKAKDQMLRAMAEAENIKRRSEKEVTDALRFGAANFAREMLVVADNLGRALESVTGKDDENAESNPLLKTLVEGVKMTEKQLLQALEQQGVKRIDPLHEKFDHNFHQAMTEMENTGHAPGTVVQVFQAGYMIHDRLLRPALVAVASGAGGKAAPHLDTKA